MILRPHDLPSIRRFVDSLAVALDEGEFVILGCPQSPGCERWTTAILDALEVCTRQKDEPSPIRLQSLGGDIEDPVPHVAVALNYPAGTQVPELLQGFGGEAITILKIACANGLSDGWRRLFAQIGKMYRVTVGSRLRPILALLTECGDFPPIEPQVGTRVKALWNVVRWEETRLLVESMLESNENALVRAWRIAVYSAAANGDPDLVTLLCRRTPSSLTETIGIILDDVNCSVSPQSMPVMPFVPDQRWEIPSVVAREWAEGWVTGITLERGTVLNISCMTRMDAQAYLLGAIWREQVAGLLPVVMDMGFSVNQGVTNAVGDIWLNGLPEGVRGPDGRVHLEPTEVIARFTGKLWIPDTLWRTLHLLKNTRNDLAHMRPVDHGLIQELWQRYDQVRHRFAVDRTAGKHPTQRDGQTRWRR